MTDLRTAAQQALEALDCPGKAKTADEQAAIAALRAALAEPVLEPVQEHEDWCASVTQLLLCNPPRKAPCNCKKKVAEPVQEPVAWAVYDIKHGGSKTLHWPEQHSPNGDPSQFKAVPLYSAPPQRKPLNEDQMYEAYINIWRNLPSGFGHTASEWIDVGVRYAERVHGIIATEVNGDKDGPQG